MPKPQIAAWIKVQGDPNGPSCEIRAVQKSEEASLLTEGDAQQIAHFASNRYPTHLWWHMEVVRQKYVVVGAPK